MFPDEPVLDAAAVVDEVRSAFEAYERALIANDVAAMDAAFWNDARVVRFGIAEIAAPLGIGELELADGSTVRGFICEPFALGGSPDITAFGGWRAYRASLNED